MFRICNRTRRSLRYSLSRCTFSSSPSQNSIHCPKDLKNPQQILSPPPPPPIIHHPSPLAPLPTRFSVLALSATLVSAVIASVVLISGESNDQWKKTPGDFYSDLQRAVDRSNESVKRIVNRMKQTGVAASVLWQSLRSVLSSANHEVRSGFEIRVAALLADIIAANASRRAAIVGAGGGKVLDWLLETVAVAGDNCGAQAESARALAYLIADPNVCEAVLGRPHAIPNLLRFIFSFQPKRSKKQSRHSSFDISDSLKGRSMLVAAIMDIVTSNFDNLEKKSFQPLLPGNAELGDVAASIQVIEEGGMHFDESSGNEDDEDGGTGLKGIGIKILGGTTVVGLSRTNGYMMLQHLNQLESSSPIPKTLMSQKIFAKENSSSLVVPGLWDDLHCQHVAVPFAAWALANWASASELNRSHIQELDQDGHAVMTALMAPERSVKWHGIMVARLLLEDNNLPLNDSVSDWSRCLLSTASQASKTEDIPLAEVALSALLVSVERSPRAKKLVMETGLPLMRETAKRMSKHRNVQEALAKALEWLCMGDMHLSLEESQKWSGILLSWVCGKVSSDKLRSSATKILSCILEDYGPASVPISQGWLAILLAEVLSSSKTTSTKGVQPGSDKVKTQIDQANILSAAQTTNQLAAAVVNLAGNQLGTSIDSIDTFPLADLLSLEPFTGPFKNLNSDTVSKFDAADSALATLKGIKALSELCAEETLSQNLITDMGVLCLLRRFLLRDDYEKLAAIEAYDASRDREAQDRVSSTTNESSTSDTNDPSSVRVPPTAHIRRHAARLLTIISLLPKVQKAIIGDKALCKWLDECANGKITGCNDLKIQSYARATLLHIFCADQSVRNSSNVSNSGNAISNFSSLCPRYDDAIFLINPELPHWKCPEKINSEAGSIKKPSSGNNGPVDSNVSQSSVNGSESCSKTDAPLDIVFVHGLRGGPFKSWRITENKSSTKSGLVEKIDQEAGKQGTFWPKEWLQADFPHARMFTLKYKTNLTQWSGASLPLQEVSAMLLQKLVAAGIGNQPVVFVTHSMGGLVVKQMLQQAKAENMDNIVNNTVGLVFYSCPHFGSKLADMPWRMGLVLRPAPTIGELRSGSPRLVELNDFIRQRHKKGFLDVISFCETKVTPIVEGYGGWAFRMEIVPIESAYPGFGELVVLDSTDHINSCKPVNRTDPSYTEILEFLNKLRSQLT